MTHNKPPTVFRAINGSPSENLDTVIELMGGMERLIGPTDVVLIKPNVQWWNQGATNLSAVQTIVERILQHPEGFQGEVVLIENSHRGPTPQTAPHSGWEHPFKRNAGPRNINNFNDLCRNLKESYGDLFSICHLIDVEDGAPRVGGPQDGPGYVYCDGSRGTPRLILNNGLTGDHARTVLLSYPIFVTDRGTWIDFRLGVWANGTYTGQPLKFINFSALNHHSTYCGISGAMKNYLGISDLSGGPDPQAGGKLTEEHYNFHSFPFNKWAAGPVRGMIGAEIGLFLQTVRKADLNIMSADWVGLVSRTELPAARTRALLASTDPVALDFHAAKYILYPNSRLSIHDPENPNTPLHHDLIQCSKLSGGCLDERQVIVHAIDCRTQTRQSRAAFPVHGNIAWGANPKWWIKYLVLRGTNAPSSCPQARSGPLRST